MRSCEVPEGGAKREGCRPALASLVLQTPHPPLPRRLTTLPAHAPCGEGAGVGVAVKMVRAKCAVASIRNLFFLLSLRAAEGGEAISALMRRTGTRRSRRPFWPPRRDTATCWPNLFTEVVFHALSVRCTKIRLNSLLFPRQPKVAVEPAAKNYPQHQIGSKQNKISVILRKPTPDVGNCNG
jgi:hypothetical protein